mgnify:FL=1
MYKSIDWTGYAFISFFSIPFIIFNISPIIFGAYVSFNKWGIFGSPDWIGLENYINFFNDGYAYLAFTNVILYAAIIVPSVTILGFIAALFVNKGWPLSAMGRTIFFSPYAVAATVVGLIWVWLLDTQYGLINQYLNFIGINNIPWITSYEWALIGVSIASIWWDLGLAFILFLAGLQDVPKDLIEAAKIDGANRFQRLFNVTIPIMRPVISMVITLQLIATLRIFSQILVMTYGGPAGGSSSPIFYIYTSAIENQLFGYSSAVSMILFIFILILTLIMRFIIREKT